MAIKFNCPNCAKKQKYDDQHGGKTQHCPDCQQVFQIPLSKGQTQQLPAAEKQLIKQQPAKQSPQMEAKKAAVIISTGPIHTPHAIIQIVFAVGSQKFGGKSILSGDSSQLTDVRYNQMIEQVYVGALNTFRDRAARVGADAIIHAKFKHS